MLQYCGCKSESDWLSHALKQGRRCAEIGAEHFEDLNVASAGGLFSASVSIPTWWRYAVNLRSSKVLLVSEYYSVATLNFHYHFLN